MIFFVFFKGFLYVLFLYVLFLYDIFKRTRETYGKCVVPEFNRVACEYFDLLNMWNGWNLRHATNGGEVSVVGYYLDAYDKGRNIAIEYDESHHFNKDGTLKVKDITRMREIINTLQCSFFRYNENKNELKEYKI